MCRGDTCRRKAPAATRTEPAIDGETERQEPAKPCCRDAVNGEVQRTVALTWPIWGAGTARLPAGGTARLPTGSARLPTGRNIPRGPGAPEVSMPGAEVWDPACEDPACEGRSPRLPRGDSPPAAKARGCGALPSAAMKARSSGNGPSTNLVGLVNSKASPLGRRDALRGLPSSVEGASK